MRDDKISQDEGAALRAPSSFGEVKDNDRAAMAVGAVIREPFSAHKFPNSGKSAGKTRAFDATRSASKSANPRVRASLPFVLPIYRAKSNRELEARIRELLSGRIPRSLV